MEAEQVSEFSNSLHKLEQVVPSSFKDFLRNNKNISESISALRFITSQSIDPTLMTSLLSCAPIMETPHIWLPMIKIY